MSPKNTIFIQAGWVGGEAACSVGEGAWSETSFLLVDIKTKTKTKTTNKAIQWKKDYQRTLFLLKSIHFVNLSNIGKGLSCTGGNSTTQGAVRLHRLLKCRWEKESETKVFEQKPGMRDGLDVLHHHLCPIARWSAKLIEEKRWGESSFGFQRRNAQVCRVKCGQGRVSPSAYARWQIKELSLADWGLYFLPSTKWDDHICNTQVRERPVRLGSSMVSSPSALPTLVQVNFDGKANLFFSGTLFPESKVGLWSALTLGRIGCNAASGSYYIIIILLNKEVEL